MSTPLLARVAALLDRLDDLDDLDIGIEALRESLDEPVRLLVVGAEEHAAPIRRALAASGLPAEMVGDGDAADALVTVLRPVPERPPMPDPVHLAAPSSSLLVLSPIDEAVGGTAGGWAGVCTWYTAPGRLPWIPGAVVAVAGRAADGAGRLEADEVEALQAVAALDPVVRRRLTTTVDRFRAPDTPDPDPRARNRLLGRLGLFGVRSAVEGLASGTADLGGLPAHLHEASGMAALCEAVTARFVAHAGPLRARSVLLALQRVAAGAGEAVRSAVEQGVEELLATSPELTLLRLESLVLSGLVEITDDERDELLALTRDPPAGSGTKPAALEGVDRWRRLAASPLNDSRRAELCDLAVQVYERRYTSDA